MNVLALHGFTGSGEDFEGLSSRCHTLPEWHCPTLPGHGPAPQLDCCPEATVEFVHQQLRTFHASLSTPSHIILGYSMGARAALNYVCAYPDSCDALILIGANPGIEAANDRRERREADEALAKRIESEGIQEFLNYWEETPLIRSQRGMDPIWRSQMIANRLQHRAEGLAVSLRQFGQGSCPNLWPELLKLQLPILLITGSEDDKYTEIAQRMRDALPVVKHQIIQDASHAPHFEQPHATAAVIDDFINYSTGTLPV